MHQDPSAAIPPEIIDLDRLRLRRTRPADAEAIFEYASDPEVARYADWPICTEIDSLVERVRQREGEWGSEGEFWWAITLPAEDRAIGTAGCHVDGHSVDFGYALNRRFWGKGHATEVSRAIVRWAFSVPSIWRLWATCDVENLASVRVLEKSGLSLEGVLRRAIIRPNLSSEPRDAFLYSKVRG